MNEPDPDREAICSQLNLVELAQQYTDLKQVQRSSTFKGICPVHHGQEEVFTVSPVRRRWHCFGACATGGDAVKLVAVMRNISEADAMEYIRTEILG